MSMIAVSPSIAAASERALAAGSSAADDRNVASGIATIAAHVYQ
jgi:hypothetical protein